MYLRSMAKARTRDRGPCPHHIHKVILRPGAGGGEPAELAELAELTELAELAELAPRTQSFPILPIQLMPYMSLYAYRC